MPAVSRSLTFVLTAVQIFSNFPIANPQSWKDLDLVLGKTDASPLCPSKSRTVTFAFVAQARHAPSLPMCSCNAELEAVIRHELPVLQSAGILSLNWTNRSYFD
jgi:hypothetical protein